MQSPRNLALLKGALIVLLTVLAYLPALRGGFIWDDDDYVTENTTLHEAGGLRRIWTDVHATPQYYPLVHTTFWLEYRAWGLKPLGYHGVNILLHGLAAVMLWRVLARLSLPGAYLAATIFALHPVGVESVVWITERKNVLSAVFYFSAALAYLHFHERYEVTTKLLASNQPKHAGKKPAASVQRPTSTWRLYSLALGLFVCALLSKTVACSLPAALLLIFWWQRGRITRREILPLVPFFIVGLALAMNTSHLEKSHVGATGADWALSFSDRCLIAGRALWFYAGKLLWPANLTFIYPRWMISAAVWWQWLFPAAAAGLVAALWFGRKKLGRGPLVAVLFFAGTLFPALGFFNVYPMRYSFVADHFQYLASVGLIVLATNALTRFSRQTVLVIPLMLGVLTWQQTHIYHDLETLWQDTIQKNEQCFLALNNLGLIRKKAGNDREAEIFYRRSLRCNPDCDETLNNFGALLMDHEQYDEAIQAFDRGLKANPNNPNILVNYGVAMRKKGRPEKALEYYQRALAIEPNNANTLNNLGSLLAEQKHYPEAQSAFEATLKLQPEMVEAKLNLGNLFSLMGNHESAEATFREAARANPDNPQVHEVLAKALADQHKTAEALIEYEAGARLNPRDATAQYNVGYLLAMEGRSAAAMEKFERAIALDNDYPDAHNNLGITLTLQGRLREATNHFAEALRLRPDYAEAHNNYAFALAQLGQRDLAIQHLREALRLQPDYPQAEKQLRDLLGSGH